MKGKLIAFEGADGSGTTTQVQKVADHFQNKTENGILTTFEPSSGPVGKVIRRWLQKELPRPSDKVMAVTFMTDRLHHYETVILPALLKGQHVFTDRFSLSTFVYQGITNSEDWVMELDRFLFIPSPHLTLVLDLPVEDSFSRINKRGKEKEIFEEKDFQSLVADRYRSIPAAYGIPHKIIDGSLRIEDVTKEIVEVLTPLL